MYTRQHFNAGVGAASSAAASSHPFIGLDYSEAMANVIVGAEVRRLANEGTSGASNFREYLFQGDGEEVDLTSVSTPSTPKKKSSKIRDIYTPKTEVSYHHRPSSPPPPIAQTIAVMQDYPRTPAQIRKVVAESERIYNSLGPFYEKKLRTNFKKILVKPKKKKTKKETEDKKKKKKQK